jgi:hypothetical protein
MPPRVIGICYNNTDWRSERRRKKNKKSEIKRGGKMERRMGN